MLSAKKFICIIKILVYLYTINIYNIMETLLNIVSENDLFKTVTELDNSSDHPHLNFSQDWLKDGKPQGNPEQINIQLDKTDDEHPVMIGNIRLSPMNVSLLKEFLNQI